MARGSQPVPASRWPLPWLEVVLPPYAVLLVLLHYRPESFVLPITDDRIELVVMWALKIFGWALGGMLALSGFFLAFYLLYSPFYLGLNLTRILDRTAWTDPREVRFYLACFGLLCVLAVLALWNPEWALVTFVILAGSAQLLWRLLI